MEFWSAENLARMTGGAWVRPWRHGEGAARVRISTDTRTLQPGDVFIAIRGERFDGNAMVGDALARGAVAAVVDDDSRLPPALPADFGVLRVACGRRALGAMAAAHRQQVLHGTCIIAVCGSNGKTTTVRLIDAVLSQKLRGRASAKSFNNDIGVPLTILSAAPRDDYLICEIGTNAPGEIAALAAIARPDIAVITSIGREHLEKLGSLRGVAAEEASVLRFVQGGLGTSAFRAESAHSPAPLGSVAVVNGDSPELAAAIADLDQRPGAFITFGEGDGADLTVSDIRQSADGVSFSVFAGSTSKQHPAAFHVPLLGRHNASNAAAAVAVGRALGLLDAQIAAGLAAARGPEMRLQVSLVRGITVINDAYNANPDSMRAALATLAELGGAGCRRVVVMGDMLELGPHAPAAHREVLQAALAVPALDLLVLVGEAMEAAAGALGLEPGRSATPGRPSLVLLPILDDGWAEAAAALLRPGDTVLLKGSRRMGLERILSAARQAGAPAGTLSW
jgi:UDP-N-acetylmuramoyl-tripeptide--D-alanyl-D-alanine ligase